MTNAVIDFDKNLRNLLTIGYWRIFCVGDAAVGETARNEVLSWKSQKTSRSVIQNR